MELGNEGLVEANLTIPQSTSLELANALDGVVRYPNGFVYNAGSNPFCGCGGNAAGCCNI